MEWGIVRGNDAYLYGEKIKAYLIRGARPLGGGRASGLLQEYPNPQVGWGTLCVCLDSLLEYRKQKNCGKCEKRRKKKTRKLCSISKKDKQNIN